MVESGSAPVALPELICEVSVESTVSDADLAFMERVLRQAVATHSADLPRGLQSLYLSLVVTDDAGIQALNREYRSIDAPTDVLSFPQHETLDLDAADLPTGVPFMLGDIVLSLPRAEAQAEEYDHARDREIGFLLVHGFLHLLGYDHETPEEAAEMEACQEAVLATLELRRATAS